MNVLVIDIGGSNIKILATGQPERIKIPSGADFTPNQLVALVQNATNEASWKFDVVGAIASLLKLPAAGFRSGDPNFGFPTDGSITFRGFGLYWSSEEYKGAVPIPGGKTFLSSRLLLIGLSSATMIGEWYNPTLTSSSRGARSIGASCRCIKD